jgi:hypothetical protein
MTLPFEIRWNPRPAPLGPTCVAAGGPTAIRLAQRLLQLSHEELAGLRGVAGENFIAVTGEPDALPWADGVAYLGKSEAAPRILLPTHSMPTVPVSILERAIIRQFPDLAPPIGVLPEPSLVFSIAEARPIARDVLETWLEVFAGGS